MNEPSPHLDLEDFFENGPIPLHLVGPDGTILKANRAELEFLGYSAEEYIGRNIAEFHADQAIIEDILARLSRGEVLRRYEARLRAKDGTIKHVLIDSSGHFHDGKLVNTRCFTRDFAVPKALEAERQKLMASERAAREHAERLNHAKDEFLVTLSHELRTPLNAVLGWARILEAEALSPDKVRHAAEVISRNAALQARLIEELLDLSRVVSGKVRLEARPMNIASVVEAAAETFKPAAAAKEVRFQIVLDSGAGPILGDPERLQQVVWNLISNAIKFTKKGGRVQVNLQRVTSHVEIVVADTGIGIAADFLPYVFDRFRQAEDSSGKVQGGLGIGLAVAQHLVQLHGGTLEASSPGVNQGAVFIVKLPVMAYAPPAVNVRGPSSGGENVPQVESRLRGLRVLVVDDDPDAVALFATTLRMHGADTRTAMSVAEAFQILEDWTPDLLLSDINMPEEDGYSFIGRIRREGRTFPAVAVTAYGRWEDRVKSLSGGFQTHVAKPVEPRELIAIVASLTGRIPPTW
jgi:PAS domain S-box-containing protein